MSITEAQYREQVNGIAVDLIRETYEWADKDDKTFDEIIDDVRDDIYDHVLHETIDGHQWVIYYAYNLDVIRWSQNPDYMLDNFGGDCLESILKDNGLAGLHTAIAYWCMYADVTDELERIWDDVVADIEINKVTS